MYFLYDRVALYIYSHAASESGRYYIFSPKLIQNNWSLYLHALKVKSSILTQLSEEGEENCLGLVEVVSFNTTLCEIPIPPSFKPPATHHLISLCSKPTVPEKQPFFQVRKNYERVKKKF